MLFLGGVLSVFACIFTPLGALVVWRQPRNAVGWLLLAIGVAVAVQSVAYGYADLALYGDRAPMPVACSPGGWATGCSPRRCSSLPAS